MSLNAVINRCCARDDVHSACSGSFSLVASYKHIWSVNVLRNPAAPHWNLCCNPSVWSPGSLIQLPSVERGKLSKVRLGSLSLKKEGERQCFLFTKHFLVCTRSSGGKLHLLKVSPACQQALTDAQPLIGCFWLTCKYAFAARRRLVTDRLHTYRRTWHQWRGGWVHPARPRGLSTPLNTPVALMGSFRLLSTHEVN